MSTRKRFGLPGPQDRRYWAAITSLAMAMETDGCTFASQAYQETCFEHDIHWRTGYTTFNAAITRQEANAALREAIQQRSWFGRWSPMAWVRWAATSVNALRLNLMER